MQGLRETMAKEPNTAMLLATQAIEGLARHEKECSQRWKEATDQMVSLKQAVRRATEATEIHAKRWEKLAWMVGGCLVALAVAQIAS